MKKEDYIKETSESLFAQACSSKEIARELADLGIRDGKSLVEAVRNSIIKTKKYPFLCVFLEKNKEDLSYLNYDDDDSFSLQMTYKGRNIMGWSIPVPEGEPGVLKDGVLSFYHTLCGFLDIRAYVTAADIDNPDHPAAKSWFLECFSKIKSWPQLYARFNLAADIFGYEIVNNALCNSDCLSLIELKEMAEADEFQDQDS